MNFDATTLILSLIPSGIGFVLFTYGKKQQRWPHMGCGIALMIYPYFTPTVFSMTAVGAGLGAALYFMVRAGW